MNTDLRIELDDSGPAAVLSVAGEIDLSNVRRFERSLAVAEDDGSVLVIDLQQVTYIDSAGIAALFSRARRGPVEVVAGPDSVVAPLLRITRLGDVARIRPA